MCVSPNFRPMRAWYCTRAPGVRVMVSGRRITTATRVAPAGKSTCVRKAWGKLLRMCVVADVRMVSPREKWSRNVLVSAPARKVIGRDMVWAERPYAEIRYWPAREAVDRSESEEVGEAKDESMRETSTM